MTKDARRQHAIRDFNRAVRQWQLRKVNDAMVERVRKWVALATVECD